MDAEVMFDGNVRKTCRYHGIAPKTFYCWLKRFDITNPRSLEDRSHRPKSSPLRIEDYDQTEKIVALRTRFPLYSKMKLAVLFEQEYHRKISSWQIQRVIERYSLYPDLKRARRLAWKRTHAMKKRRIGQCVTEPWTGWLISMDTIVLHVCGKKRYILTAIDHFSRVMIARAYATHSSRVTADFLQRVYDYFDSRVQNVHTDNGPEFHDQFMHQAKRLKLTHWWSRTHTPKDNAINERVNRTLQHEFLPAYRFCENLDEFNSGLTTWMTHYNWERPHQSLKYKTPMEIARTHPNPYPKFLE